MGDDNCTTWCLSVFLGAVVINDYLSKTIMGDKTYIYLFSFVTKATFAEPRIFFGATRSLSQVHPHTTIFCVVAGALHCKPSPLALGGATPQLASPPWQLPSHPCQQPTPIHPSSCAKEQLCHRERDGDLKVSSF